MIKFGTDGIRGLAYSEISASLAYKLGNSLCSIIETPRILIGRDTRESGDYLQRALEDGVLAGGGIVLSLGIVPTPGVAYLLEEYSCDFGVVITASHNSEEYNGLKVFDRNSGKLSQENEEAIERLLNSDSKKVANLGYRDECVAWQEKYINFLVLNSINLKGLKILIDCANGAFSPIAEKIFLKLGAKVTCINDDGIINDACGALYASKLSNRVVEEGFDMAFAFDGDGDRLISLDEKGKVFDGDSSLYAIAVYLYEKGELTKNTVVGTVLTNMGIEKALLKEGIYLKRVNVGDKYILRELEKGYALGGEQSGHTIIYNSLKTGDGALTAVTLAKIVKEKNIPLSCLCKVQRFEQINESYDVSKKILEDKDFNIYISSLEEELKDGRILVRASGTENKIRTMIEGKQVEIVNEINRKISKFIREYS